MELNKRMPDLLRRLWMAWRSLLESEDARWKGQLGDPESTARDSEKAACVAAPKAPSLADLVNERRSELKHDPPS